MNKEQTAIAKTIELWMELAETGEDKPELKGVNSSCFLCQYALEMKKPTESKWAICKYCPYQKKYGHCNSGKLPFALWDDAETKADKRIHAKAFLEQVKTLQEKPMDKKEIAQEIKATEEKLATLHKSLEKPEKPKLRHGDYGFDNHGQPMFVDDGRYSLGSTKCEGQREKARWLYKEGGYNNECEGYTILGNIFADLKALAEPLKNSWYSSHGKNNCNLTILVLSDGIWMGTSGNSDIYSIEIAEETHRVLGRAIHTAKMQAQK